MKTYRLFLILTLISFKGVVLGQDMLGLMKRVSVLEYQKKYREELSAVLQLQDTLKKMTGHINLDFAVVEAKLYINIGNYTKAEQLLKQIMSQAGVNSVDAKKLYQKTLYQLSRLYEKMGNDEGVETILEKLIVSEYANQDPKVLADSLNKIDKSLADMQLGNPKYRVADTQQAKTYDIIRKVQSQYTDPLLKAEIISGQVTKAPRAKQIALLKKGKLKFVGERVSLGGEPWEDVDRLFLIYKKTHNYNAADSLIRRAIALDDKNPGTDLYNSLKMFYSPGLMNSLNSNPAYKGLGAIAKQSLAIYEKHSGADIYYIRNKVLLAQLYQDNDKLKEYELLTDTIYRLCKQFDTVSSPVVINSIADTYFKIGKYHDAETEYKKLLMPPGNELDDNSLFSLYFLSSLQQLAEIYKLTNRYNEAELVLKQALAYDKNMLREDYPDHLDRIIDLAQLYENTNNYALAERYCDADAGAVLNNLTNNFSFLSEQEKLLWLNSQISAFDFSASLLVTDAKPSDEFILQTCDQQLQLKGVVLNDEENIFAGIHKSGNNQLTQLLSVWQNNRSEIAWQYSQPASPEGNRRLDSLNTIANEQEKKIDQLSGLLSSNHQKRRVNFRQIQAELKDGEAAVEFVHFNYYHKKWTNSIKYGAFIILYNDKKPHFVTLCNENQLVHLLDIKNGQALYDFYGDSAVNIKNNKKSDTLYRLIWQPLSPYLKDINKISIAPAGLLNRIAFNALPCDKGKYLTDKYEIRQYSTISEIAGRKKPKDLLYKTGVVLYGGINYGERDISSPSGNAWRPLTTLKEVNGIDSLFKTKNLTVQVITGANATEESLKQLSGHSPGILHIATHGFFKPDNDPRQKTGFINEENQSSAAAANPMFRSGIIMAGANRVWSGGLPVEGKEDGIVTAYEIADLDLSNTDLVVLSACETALGDIKGTEGVFGLQRAFKLAGVKNMLLSLWDIPDEQTSELMQLFYTGKLGGMDNYQALHSAQETMRKKFPPYFWAGFELIE